MKSPLLRAACACAVTFCVVSAKGETLLVTQDTAANGIRPTDNYGTATLLNVRDYGPINTFIEFDVSSLSGSTVESATLVIDVVTVKAGGTLDVRLVDSAWSENTLTFNTQPGFSGPQGNILVANGDAGGTVSVDVTAIVQGWADGTIANYGLALTPSNINVRLGSKEGGAPAKLEITLGAGGTPTGTTVRVPQDFKTIQDAIDNATQTWCPPNAPRCVITIGPGEYEGFRLDYNQASIPPFTIVGAGKDVTTVVGRCAFQFNGLYTGSTNLRNLTVETTGEGIGAIWPGGPLVVENVDVPNGSIGDDTGVDISLSNVFADRVNCFWGVSLTDGSGARNALSADNCSLDIDHSSVRDLEIINAAARIQNSSVTNISVNFSSSLRILGSVIWGAITSESTNKTIKCVSVVNANFDEYLPDCTLPAP